MSVVRQDGFAGVPTDELERSWPEPTKRRCGTAFVDPTVVTATGEDEDRALLSYPYIKQVKKMRKTGVEWLLMNDQADKDGDLDMEDVEGDEDEDRRWGAATASAVRGSRVVTSERVGRVVRQSAFGRAVDAFDEALVCAVRERETLLRVQNGHGSTDNDDETGIDIGKLVRGVREVLYKRIEDTLNGAAMSLARNAVPVGFRGKNVTEKRIYRSATDIASFPPLPELAIDWYEPQEEYNVVATQRVPGVARGRGGDTRRDDGSASARAHVDVEPND